MIKTKKQQTKSCILKKKKKKYCCNTNQNKRINNSMWEKRYLTELLKGGNRKIQTSTEQLLHGCLKVYSNETKEFPSKSYLTYISHLRKNACFKWGLYALNTNWQSADFIVWMSFLSFNSWTIPALTANTQSLSSAWNRNH